MNDEARKALEYLQNANVQAFYMVVRKTESSMDDRGYFMVNGRPDLTDLSRHPYEGMLTTKGGRAAGAPQFIPSTWGDMVAKFDLPDFSRQSQDIGYIGCLQKRHALEDVLAGRFDDAVVKCRLEWTSLPNAGESNPKWTMNLARALFVQKGGTLVGTQPAAPIEERDLSNVPPAQPKEETNMAAFLIPLLQTLLPSLPQLVGLFGKNAETADKNAKAAQVVADVALKTLGAVNEQDAIEKLELQPELKKEVAKAVLAEPYIAALVEVGGGVAKARDFDLATQNQPKPFYKTSAVFWISIIMLPMVFWYVGSSIVGGIAVPADWPWYAQLPLKLFGVAWDAGARVGLANLVVGLILGGIVGVYYGVSVTKPVNNASGQ